MGAYLTISSPIDIEITVRRSRFIASLRSAKDRAEFDVALKKIQSAYPRATHYCWAYRFDSRPMTEHSSDAGEPSGSAGRPILGVLKRHSLVNTAAVVTRYFGGVKLGVKGLIDAYSASAEEAVASAAIIEDEPRVVIKFASPYSLYSIIANLASSFGDDLDLEADFSEDVSGRLVVKESVLDPLTGTLQKLSNEDVRFKFHVELPDLK